LTSAAYLAAAADAILVQTLHVLDNEDRSLLVGALDELPAPIDVTDADGVITHNPACLAFAGRVPAVGRDRWCVTWKLYTEDGAFLPHD
jgi:hypothetical protein